LNLDKISITNQQISCYKLHLQQLLQVCKDKNATHAVSLKKAYSQSLSLHFVLVYRAFLQEIAADYRVQISLDESFFYLNVKLEKEGVVSAQCQMLADLERDPTSWLSLLLEQYQSTLLLKAKSSVNAASIDRKLIEFKDLSDVKFEETIELAAQQLTDIIEQYRNLMQEW